MRVIIVLLTVFSLNFAWAGVSDKFCIDYAEAYFKGYHQRVLDEVGVIQGYSEEISLNYSQKINELDQRDETFHFIVKAGNSKMESWTTEYVISVEAWLGTNGNAHACIITEMDYRGITVKSPGDL